MILIADHLYFLVQHSLGTFVHPSGIERPIHQCIDAMESLHGDRQGKRFRVWVDQVSSAQIGSDTWLVKCKKWESYGEIAFLYNNIYFHVID